MEPEIAPLARRLAEENNVDWRKLSGTGSDGRIVERDVLDYLARVMAGDEAVDPTPEPLPEGMEAWPDQEGGPAADRGPSQRTDTKDPEPERAEAEDDDDEGLLLAGDDLFDDGDDDDAGVAHDEPYARRGDSPAAAQEPGPTSGGSDDDFDLGGLPGGDDDAAPDLFSDDSDEDRVGSRFEDTPDLFADAGAQESGAGTSDTAPAARSGGEAFDLGGLHGAEHDAAERDATADYDRGDLSGDLGDDLGDLGGVDDVASDRAASESAAAAAMQAAPAAATSSQSAQAEGPFRTVRSARLRFPASGLHAALDAAAATGADRVRAGDLLLLAAERAAADLGDVRVALARIGDDGSVTAERPSGDRPSRIAASRANGGGSNAEADLWVVDLSPYGLTEGMLEGDKEQLLLGLDGDEAVLTLVAPRAPADASTFLRKVADDLIDPLRLLI